MPDATQGLFKNVANSCLTRGLATVVSGLERPTKGWTKAAAGKSKAVSELPSNQEIAKLKENDLTTTLKKFAALEISVARKRKNFENRKASSPKINESASICKEDFDDLTKKKEKLLGRQSILAEKVNSLKERTCLKKICDRIIVFFSAGKVKSASVELNKVSGELKEVCGKWENAKDLLDLTNGILAKQQSRQLKDKAELFGCSGKGGHEAVVGLVTKVIEMEDGIVKELAVVVREDSSALTSKDGMRKQWDAAWEGLLEGGKISKEGKSELERLRDERWNILCRRANLKSEENNVSFLLDELKSAKPKSALIRGRLQAADQRRHDCLQRYKKAEKEYEAASVEAEKLKPEIAENEELNILDNSMSAKVQDPVLKNGHVKPEQDRKKALTAKNSKLAAAEEAMLKAEGEMDKEKLKLERLETDVETLKRLLDGKEKTEIGLEREIKAIKKVTDKSRKLIEKDRIKAMTDQQKYIMKARGEKVPEGWVADNWSRSGYR